MTPTAPSNVHVQVFTDPSGVGVQRPSGHEARPATESNTPSVYRSSVPTRRVGPLRRCTSRHILPAASPCSYAAEPHVCCLAVPPPGCTPHGFGTQMIHKLYNRAAHGSLDAVALAHRSALRSQWGPLEPLVQLLGRSLCLAHLMRSLHLDFTRAGLDYSGKPLRRLGREHGGNTRLMHLRENRRQRRHHIGTDLDGRGVRWPPLQKLECVCEIGKLFRCRVLTMKVSVHAHPLGRGDKGGVGRQAAAPPDEERRRRTEGKEAEVHLPMV